MLKTFMKFFICVVYAILGSLVTLVFVLLDVNVSIIITVAIMWIIGTVYILVELNKK